MGAAGECGSPILAHSFVRVRGAGSDAASLFRLAHLCSYEPGAEGQLCYYASQLLLLLSLRDGQAVTTLLLKGNRSRDAVFAFAQSLRNLPPPLSPALPG